MASTAPKRRLRDPNDIFASLDRPVATSSSPPKNDNPITASSPLSSPTKSIPTTTRSTNAATKTQYVTNSTTRYTKPQVVTSRRVMSISKRFMGTTGSLLRRSGSPPRGRRSPPPRRTSVRKASGGRGGIKPPLDLGPQHSPYDTVNVRERVRKWQANGGGVIEADTTAYVPPLPVATGESAPRSESRNPEKRRTMLADYTVNHSFDELETSSARWGMEPLALPAPPALTGYGSNAGSWKGSRPSSVISGGAGGMGEWEDAMSGAEMSGREDKSAWNSAPEDKKVVTSGTKKKKKRVPREGMDVEAMRARKERRKKKLIAVSDHEREMERSVKGREETIEVEVIETSSVFEIPGIDLEATEDTAVVPMAAIDDAPPPLPRHAGSMPALKAAAAGMKSIEDVSPSLNSKQSVKSLGGTPASVMSDRSKDETISSSLLDDDGIRVTPIRRRFTKAEKREIHKQRQAEREEFLEREKNRIREEERLRYQEIERIREEERQKEIERIKEEERQKVLEEEEQREEERRKIRELDLKAYREREEQKKREKEKEERRRQRELLREQERQREIERIREEEKLKVIEEMRIEQERERERQERERERLEEKRLEQERERERIDQERELARLDEQRRIAREEERHQEIMSEIERATQRSTTRAKKKKKEKENYMLEEVQKRVGPDALRSKEEMAAVIKATVVEVMGEMFGEIIFEDDTKQKEASDRANLSSTVTADSVPNTASTEPEYDTRTRETTPETHKSPVQRARRIFSPLEKLEKSPPPMPPGHNDITYRPVEFGKTVPEIHGFKRPFPMGIGFKRPAQQATEPKKPVHDIVEPKKPVHDTVEPRKPAHDTVEPKKPPPEIPEPKRPAPEAPIPEPDRPAPRLPKPERTAPEIILPKKSIPEIIEAKPSVPEESNYKKPAVEAVPESPPEHAPEQILEDPASSPPGSPETSTNGDSFALPKRRINLFGSQSAKRRRKPFQATIPEESASQLSVESEPASPPSAPSAGRRDFSFAPRTEAEPISPPITRQVSAASQPAYPADAVSPPARQLSVASRASHHTNASDHSFVSSSQIHRNLPKDENLDLSNENLSTGLTRSLTSPAAHTNLAKDEDPGDEYFVSVNEPLKGSGIKRYKSTADLISLLSERRPSSVRPKSIRSTRSIRSVKNKVVVGTLTLRDLLVELATEELSYTADLQLLEHRIIPVLLEAKLAKTDKDAAAGKRASPEKLMENNPLKSIVDVNIALKRLNGVHDRLADAIKAATTNQASEVAAVPNPDEILKWAQASKYVYEDYIAYWRMDWDEVVINTTVLEAIEKKKGVSNVGSAGVAGVLSGGVLAGNGKNGGSIDVGYLLKRPLVRTRVLTKLFKL
ncbi:hypothetical protein TWF481_012007 [Arthrobotrys musiformis]|uniref:DBL homology domain-containing protein n=1 Tax=Arthrobotrys musiformis TaxID=47236 RepID=A0AAV9VVS6_9PEZI